MIANRSTGDGKPLVAEGKVYIVGYVENVTEDGMVTLRVEDSVSAASTPKDKQERITISYSKVIRDPKV